LALRIERALPFLRRVLCCSGRDDVIHDAELRRWMMSTRVVSGGVGGGRSSTAMAGRCNDVESLDELLKVIQRLDNKLDHRV